MLSTNYMILAEAVVAFSNPNPQLVKAINEAPRIQVEQKTVAVSGMSYYRKTADKLEA